MAKAMVQKKKFLARQTMPSLVRSSQMQRKIENHLLTKNQQIQEEQRPAVPGILHRQSKHGGGLDDAVQGKTPGFAQI